MVVRVTGIGVHRFLETYFDFRTLIEQNDVLGPGFSHNFRSTSTACNHILGACPCGQVL